MHNQKRLVTILCYTKVRNYIHETLMIPYIIKIIQQIHYFLSLGCSSQLNIHGELYTGNKNEYFFFYAGCSSRSNGNGEFYFRNKNNNLFSLLSLSISRHHPSHIHRRKLRQVLYNVSECLEGYKNALRLCNHTKIKYVAYVATSFSRRTFLYVASAAENARDATYKKLRIEKLVATHATHFILV